MSGLTIKLEDHLNLDHLTDEIKEVIDQELRIFGEETVGTAKTLSPIDEGTLRSSITYEKRPLEVEIIAAVFYAAYVEFGTGVFAAAYVPSLPAPLQEYAKTFFVNGKGRVPARPFLIPAIEANVPLLIDN